MVPNTPDQWDISTCGIEWVHDSFNSVVEGLRVVVWRHDSTLETPLRARLVPAVKPSEGGYWVRQGQVDVWHAGAWVCHIGLNDLWRGEPWYWVQDPYFMGCMRGEAGEFGPVYDLRDDDGAIVAGRVVELYDGALGYRAESVELDEPSEHAGAWALSADTVCLDAGSYAESTVLEAEARNYHDGLWCLESDLVTAFRRGRCVEWPESDTGSCDCCGSRVVCSDLNSDRYDFDAICDRCAEDYCSECERSNDDCRCGNESSSDGVRDYSDDPHEVLGRAVPRCGLFDLTIGVEWEVEHSSQSGVEDYGRDCEYAGVGIVCHDGSLGSYGGELKMIAVKYSDWSALLKRVPVASGACWDTTTCGIHVNVGFPSDVSHELVRRVLHGLCESAYAHALLKKFGRRLSAYGRIGSACIGYGEKYNGIAVHKSKCAEFRLFKGTLNRSSLQVYVDFAHAVMLWACSASKAFGLWSEAQSWAQSSEAVESLKRWLLEFGSAEVHSKTWALCSEELQTEYKNQHKKEAA